jgi:hypothetical protein
MDVFISLFCKHLPLFLGGLYWFRIIYRGCIGICGVEPSGSNTGEVFMEVMLYV